VSDGSGERQGPDKAPAASTGGLFKRASLRSPNEAIQPEAAPPPPEPKAKKRPRSSISSTISGVMSFLVVAGLLLLGAVAYGVRQFDVPGPLQADKVVMIPPGSGTSEIVELLTREGVISDPTILQGAALAKAAKFKAGEYLFKAGATQRQVLGILVEGKAIQHSLTIPEGLTSEQIVQRLRENDVLMGDVREIPKEGSLAPDTYKFGRGMTRDQFLSQMRRRQNELVEQIWSKRAADLPLRSSGELVTLASIVEKETGKGDERPRVAGVFVNRLQKRMRLQSDPTIVYGLVGGKGTLGRGILRAEVTQPTAYNTYVIDGLPPGPIANPGRAALEAVANPAHTRDLYFVADGSGGHVFAETLAEHNANVARWRQIERDAKDRAAPDVAPDAGPAPAGLPQRPQRRGALEAPAYGALPARLGIGDATHAAVGGGPDLARAAARLLGRGAQAQPVESASVWSGRIGALAFASVKDGAAEAAKAIAAATQEAAAPPAQQHGDAGGVFAYRPALEDVAIIGVNTTAGYMDIEEDPETAAAKGNMQTFPVSSARQADLRARAAQYGLPQTSAVAALPIIDAPAAPAPPSSGQPARPRVVDVSEGTSLDPLKATGWDLDSPKTIPPIRPLPKL
jgi:UPF0755 protein